MEALDFCRVKKFNEKGYGFLKGIYYPEDIFFHLSKIKNEVFKEKFNNLVRGSFFLYFISMEVKGKRKVKTFWYDLTDVPAEYVPLMTDRIIYHLNEGKINLFDLIYVINELKKNNFLPEKKMEEILSSNRILAKPTVILEYLSQDELVNFTKILDLNQYKKFSNKDKPYWLEDVKEFLSK